MRWFLLSLALVTAAEGTAFAQDESIYQLETPLLSASGHHVRLDVFRGHLVVISMFYGTCPAACPLLISRLKAIDAELDPATQREVRYLLVSFDPRRDKPAVLTHLMAVHQLDPSRWMLGAASDQDARTLAEVLGIRYRLLPGGVFQHDSRFVVLDGTGVIAANEDVFSVSGDHIGRVLTTLADSRHARTPSG